jgi:NAD-dependent dihydropyrimidine dehydrogenase PreA subunit
MKDIPYGKNGNKGIIRNQRKYHIYRIESYRAKQGMCKHKKHVLAHPSTCINELHKLQGKT